MTQPPVGLANKPVIQLLIFFAFFAVPLYAIHAYLLDLPFFWDEQGQFIPTALDILRHGYWIARSTVPNVHPPGVEAYLALWYRVFGYSIPATRVAMLLCASLGLLLTFLLAIELSRGIRRPIALMPPFLLLVSPLFFTQSMMAQLDMPAMVFTLLSLLLFLSGRYAYAALACIALVLVKETGLVVPFVFFLLLALRRDWKRAALFVPSAVALGIWLLVLHHGTGYWLGDPGFAHYNVGYSLNPVRMLLSLLRRIYYLFFAEFRWIGTAALLYILNWGRTNRSQRPHYTFSALFPAEIWRPVALVAAGTVILVSIFGGAELERYLLPVLPIFYIAVSIAFTLLPKRLNIAVFGLLAGGLIVNVFWNPSYPFPYENNYAMVDFVNLQKAAAGFAQDSFPASRIATAWPYTAALQNPDYGFVDRKLTVVETNDFHQSSIAALPSASFDVLITYTRTWMPADGVIAIPWIRSLLTRFYEWQPDITPDQCAALGLRQMMSLHSRGQQITIYVRGAQQMRPGKSTDGSRSI